MLIATVTFIDVTKGPWSLATIFTGTAPGLSIVLGQSYRPPAEPLGYSLNNMSPSNQELYIGNSQVRNDGTLQAARVDQSYGYQGENQFLDVIFVHASANGAIMNVNIG